MSEERSDLDAKKTRQYCENFLEEFTKAIVSEPSSKERVIGAMLASSTLLVMLAANTIKGDAGDPEDIVAGMIKRAFAAREKSLQEGVMIFEIRPDPETPGE